MRKKASRLTGNAITTRYIYDHMGRKLKDWQQVTNGTTNPPRTLVSQIDYNEIGQVLTKHLHSTDSVNFLQNIAYTYNERGWLLTSSAPLFAMQLQYNTGVNKQYNGNIMYQYFGTPGNLSNHFTYGYDALNRLVTGNSVDANNENGIAYDLNGNITALRRYQAGTLTDELAYSYANTNQLQSIADNSGSNTGLVNGTTTYTYDGNGNEKSNANTVNTIQNKSFTYNLLNLPQTVTVPTGTITYTYDVAGQKLRKVSVLSGVTKTIDYIDGIQYDGTATTDTLSFIQTEEGRAVHNGSGYDYQYYLGDNLGNTRVTFNTKKGSAYNIQQDDYYPFGLEINRSIVPNQKNEYLYNKKELQEELGLYDYGARLYDPVVARWLQIDPLAEKGRRWSPYNYVENNPIRMTDPDGMIGEDANDGPIITNPEEIASIVNQLKAQSKTSDSHIGKNINSGTKNGKGQGKAPEPKDGDRNKAGEMYSEFSHRYVSPSMFYDLKRVQEKLQQDQEAKDSETKAYTALGEFLVGAGKGALKGTASYMAGEAFFGWLGGILTNGVEGTTVVLGSRGMYEAIATDMGAETFQVPEGTWTWTQNAAFLDKAAESGAKFVFSNSVREVPETSIFYKEVKYLVTKYGYKIAQDGMSLSQ